LAALLGSFNTRAQEPASGQPMSSAEALRTAAQNNPSLKAALLDERRAAEAVRAEEGLYPLMLQLDGGYTHSSTPSLDADGGVSHRSADTTTLGAQLSKTLPVGTETSVRVEGDYQVSSGTAGAAGPGASGGSAYGLTTRLAVTQPLLRGAGTTVVEASLREALRSEELARLRARRVSSETAANVLTTYWDLWYADQAVAIEVRARDLARAQLEEIEARVQEGDAAPVDVLPFQTRLATLEEGIVAAAAERDRLAVQLAGLLGFASGTTHVAPDGSEAPATSERQESLEQAVATALVNSPDVRERLAEIALAEERARTAGEQMRPRLDLMGWLQADTLGNDELAPVFEQYGDGEAYSVYVGLLYELPLSDTRKQAQRASAQLDVDIANEQLLAERDTVKAAVLRAHEDALAARRRLELAEETLRVAEQQAEAERERYHLGAAIFVQVREAEEAVREAELRTVRARVDLAQAEIEIDQLTGRLLERYRALVRGMPNG